MGRVLSRRRLWSHSAAGGDRWPVDHLSGLRKGHISGITPFAGPFPPAVLRIPLLEIDLGASYMIIFSFVKSLVRRSPQAGSNASILITNYKTSGYGGASNENRAVRWRDRLSMLVLHRLLHELCDSFRTI